MNLASWLKGLTILLALAAAWQAGNAGWIAGKAHVAQVLMDRAWDHSDGGRVPVKLGTLQSVTVGHAIGNLDGPGEGVR